MNLFHADIENASEREVERARKEEWIAQIVSRMNVKWHMHRRLGSFALVFVASCTFCWNKWEEREKDRPALLSNQKCSPKRQHMRLWVQHVYAAVEVCTLLLYRIAFRICGHTKRVVCLWRPSHENTFFSLSVVRLMRYTMRNSAEFVNWMGFLTRP